MRTVYRRLFRIRMRHAFYESGEALGDFALEATASTARLLDSTALRVRSHPDGLTVFGEVEPDSSPARLMRPIGADPLRFVFALRVENPHAPGFSNLPQFRPGMELFCFDNLRADVVAGRKLLGDAIAGARLGAPLKLVGRSFYEHRLAAPASSAGIEFRDRFGELVAATRMEHAGGATSTTARIDLTGLPGLRPGRYRVSGGGNTADLYFDPDLEVLRPLGVIEIYSRTTGLAPGPDRVPAAYRFLDGDQLLGLDTYYVQFEARSTLWRYHVRKKYGNNSVNLNQLSIGGPIPFGKTSAAGEVTFTSNAAIALRDAPRGLKLKEGNKELRALPEPEAATPLAAGAAPGSYASDIFVNV